MTKILIPYDFTEQSDTVLNYGLGLAKELKADITLLNITPYPVVTPEIGLPAFSYKDVMEDSLKELKKLAAKLNTLHSDLNSIECFAEMGDVSESVVEYCKEHPFEFVVMGVSKHGSKLMKNLMGSNAVATAHKTKCTVIIVPSGTAYKKPLNLAFATEPGISENDAAVTKAKAISSLFKAELQMLHVVPENHHFAPGEVVLNNYFERKEEKQPHKLFIITEKKISEGLLGMLDNNMIDMLLIEPKEHSAFYKLFHESVSKEIAFASPVPVVLIHS